MYRSPSSDIQELLTMLNNILSEENNCNEIMAILGDLYINIVGIN